MSVALASAGARGQYQGVLRILMYNWSFYAATLLVSAVIAAALRRLPLPMPLAVGLGLASACAAFWLVTSLVISHYVYDRSKLYEWAWLGQTLPAAPRRWANLHAGLDEASAPLSGLFPAAQTAVLDIYDGKEMTEVSIARARRWTPAALPARKADLCALPLSNGECDALFLIFVAHEIRRARVRQRFFAELYRVLEPGGTLVLVEHLRDGWNFLAFGPGFLHFLSRREWARLATGAKFCIQDEFSVTPFVRIFLLRKPV